MGYNKLTGGAFADVGPLLQFGKPNVLVFTTNKSGFMGDAFLIHYPVPVETLPVTGEWQVQATQDRGLVPASLPGKFEGLIAFKRDVVIPAAWKGFTVTRVFRGKKVRVEVHNPAGVQQGVRKLELNGALLEGNLIPAAKLADQNRVVVEMG